jgi:hypothetical protein
MYMDLSVRRNLMKRKLDDGVKIKREPSRLTHDISEWTYLKDGQPLPGHFWVWEHEIDDIRLAWLAIGKSPKAILKSEHTIKTLSYTFHRGEELKGTCTLHTMPPHSTEIKMWLQELPTVGIRYMGQGVPNISFEVMRALMFRKVREYASPEQRHEIMANQDWQCNQCGDRAWFEMDHVARLSENPLGAQDFQALCKSCHRAKTGLESASHHTACKLVSHFDEHAWTEYVLSPRASPLILKYKEVDVQLKSLKLCDIVKCRRRALEFNQYPIPIYSVLDQITRRQEFKVYDSNYIDTPYKCCIKQNGYTGPGWYSRSYTEWALYSGTCNWSQIPYVFDASAHLPAESFAAAIHEMDIAWDRCEGRLMKQSINSAIGIMMLDETYAYKLTSSKDPNDAPLGPEVFKRYTHYDGGAIIDWVTKTLLKSTTSYRPIHDMCMGFEAQKLGEAIWILKKQGATIYQLRTDSILYKPKRGAKDILINRKFTDPGVRDLFDPGVRRLDSYCSQTINSNNENVYRVINPSDKDIISTEVNPPDRKSQPPQNIDFQWKTIDQKKQSPCWLTKDPC